MKRRYASFLIRWWQHGSGRQRVTVSHIQSGEQVSPRSLPAAFAWIAERAAAADDDGSPDATPAPDGPPPDGDDDPPPDTSS